ncbi:flagellar basal body P-ring formation chaperone FlgA [Syntrophus aciditrophicus]|jgi:flagella basal body P-ring formation protein FlgA|uniref:Flagella basal body P-ring formation protein FlgA n=1 Tax=Syntrophus aciditrophicus (strain SB) TaxID=56780 RepID=Q2LT22_SYNAS|nr:flagellar basal body P-ring formation chaperone FlgA [Syntrophus aciditrophicus]ABC77231.1 flagellar basal body P-ring biosynthesis protein [Syntrophus aciditrophicus SB]
MAKSSGISILVFLACCFIYAGVSGKELLAFEGRTLNESLIKAAIVDHVEKHMTWPKGSIRITFPNGVPEVTLSREDFTLHVKENKSDEYIGNRLYQVKIRQRNNFLKHISVPTRIEVCRDVALSARPLERNRNISEHDILIVKKWFSRLPQDLLADPERIIGKRLLRSIKERSTFTASMLREPILFKKGKVVKVICDNGVLSITTLGLAEEEGTLGATVKIKNISSNKIIHAKVIGNSVVKVEI